MTMPTAGPDKPDSSQASPRNGQNGSSTSPEGSLASLLASSTSDPSTLVRVASVLLQRAQLSSRLGFDQFSGRRKLYEVLGYPTSISFDDYNDRFKRGGIARRIIKTLPSMMGWGKFQVVERAIDEKGGKSKTKFENEFQSLRDRLSLPSVFKRADILAGIGEYSGIYLGVREKGTIDGKANANHLQNEISTLTGPDDLVYIRPLDKPSCEILEYVGDKPDDDVSDPRYGLPRYYDVRINGGISNTGMTGKTRKVHWSRIIHVTHEPLDNELFSAPALESVYNYLIDLDKLAGGGSEAVYREAVRRVLFDLDANIGPDQIDTPSKEALKDNLEDMMHNLKQYVFTRGVTPKTIDTSPVKFGENVKTIISLVSATLDIAQRRLMGSESAYASADIDKTSEEEVITARQDEFGTPLIRQFVDRLVKYNGLVTPSKYEIAWPSEDKKKIGKKVEVLRSIGLANQAQVKATGKPFVTSDEGRDMLLDLEPLPEVVEEEEEEEEEVVVVEEKAVEEEVETT